MRVILDPSAAVRIALNRNPLPEHRDAIARADSVSAPELIVPEVTNAIWKYHQSEKLEIETCQQVLEFILRLVDKLVSGKDLYREAFLLARTSGFPADDTFYLVLARRDDATLLTADRLLRKEAARQGVRVI